MGRYDGLKVWLKKGGTEAYLDSRTQQASGRITVSEKAASRADGGRAADEFGIHRQRGKELWRLNYQLVGAGGAYELVNQDRSHPPEFTVYQGDKKMASGKFQFG